MIPTFQLGQFGRRFVNADPYAGFVASLIHFDGTDAATTITDEVSTNSWTAAGNAQLDTAQSRYGGCSLLLDGTGDYFSCPSDPKFQVSGDVTVEISIRAVSWTAGGNYLASKWDGGLAGADAWILYYNTTDTTLHLDFRDTNDSTFRSAGVTVSGGISTGAWHDIAACRSGNTFYFFVDGTLVGSVVNTAVMNPDGSASMRLGAIGTSSANMFNGWLDEFRYTPGIARYTASYTPTGGPFPYP